MELDKELHIYFPFGVQVSKKSWDWLKLGKLYEDKNSLIALSNAFAIRKIADQYNLKCVHGEANLWPIRPGQLVTVSVIVDILRHLLTIYCQEENPRIVSGALGWIDARTQTDTSRLFTKGMLTYFPPKDVILGKPPEKFLNQLSEQRSPKELVVEEAILLSLSMENPAFKPYKPFFNTKEIKETTPFDECQQNLEQYFKDKPAFGPTGESLYESLRAPMKACPNSLEGQLDYIKTNWAVFLPKGLLKNLLMASDILREETQVRGWGPGPNISLEFGQHAYGIHDYEYPEPSAFSRDADWMSNVVILAKSTYVWLDQLSKKYQMPINILSDIPDDELDQLSRWGVTGLWLIGLWERSRASQKIKQIMGNPEAAPSAYSLYDYTIATDLGGEEAYQNLRERAGARGIRLASDMVPNHMGIYSRWVVEHPDWFVQSDHPPFPVYQFTGVNLSEDESVTVQIEDGYWEHRDASVVFKRIDNNTGEARYIYHGNDGTSTPWNDTAQLNFMMDEVREAVVQTILHVARKCPIIRFDAAMTLAKKHYQRLWFPQPGDGGAIPSRAEHAMTRSQFDAAFPKEFWREVVDRIASEVPDTLLLAEAFWLMEGYFVRTLGMHRVYNSAFMNMLKMEENSKYRTTIKNVLEFSPEVLKRFVNFMNNPDEKTAVEQFGKGDKYFGIAMMMVTMPGLPMLGHGQIEGFTEKYGMEYYRAYWDEQIDEDLVKRHEREIFPLMRRRNLFSGSHNYAMYDYCVPEGWVNENVFAYTNTEGNERAVILFNNSYDSTQGTIKTSTAINVGEADEKALIQKNIALALKMNTAPGHLYRFVDYRTRLQYLKSGEQIERDGISCKLDGYQYCAFMDFTEIYDSDGSWTELMNRLDGQGTYDIDIAYKEMKLESLLYAFGRMLDTAFTGDIDSATIETLSNDFKRFHMELKQHVVNIQEFTESELRSTLQPLLKVYNSLTELKQINSKNLEYQSRILIIYSVCKYLHNLAPKEEVNQQNPFIIRLLDDWLLRKAFTDYLGTRFNDKRKGYFDSQLLVALLLSKYMQDDFDWTEYFTYNEVRDYLQINAYEDKLWFNSEMFEKFVLTHMIIDLCDDYQDADTDLTNSNEIIANWLELPPIATKAGFQVEKFLKLIKK